MEVLRISLLPGCMFPRCQQPFTKREIASCGTSPTRTLPVQVGKRNASDVSMERYAQAGGRRCARSARSCWPLCSLSLHSSLHWLRRTINAIIRPYIWHTTLDMFLLRDPSYSFPPLSVLTKTNLNLGLPALKSGSALLISSMLYFWIYGDGDVLVPISCSAANSSIFRIMAGLPMFDPPTLTLPRIKENAGMERGLGTTPTRMKKPWGRRRGRYSSTGRFSGSEDEGVPVAILTHLTDTH